MGSLFEKSWSERDDAPVGIKDLKAASLASAFTRAIIAPDQVFVAADEWARLFTRLGAEREVVFMADDMAAANRGRGEIAKRMLTETIRTGAPPEERVDVIRAFRQGLLYNTAMVHDLPRRNIHSAAINRVIEEDYEAFPERYKDLQELIAQGVNEYPGPHLIGQLVLPQAGVPDLADLEIFADQPD